MISRQSTPRTRRRLARKSEKYAAAPRARITNSLVLSNKKRKTKTRNIIYLNISVFLHRSAARVCDVDHERGVEAAQLVDAADEGVREAEDQRSADL